VVIYDGDARAGGMMRTQIPKFRLPEEVIDEETGYILGLGVDFRGGQYVSSLKDLLAEGYDAIFVGSGAPRGQHDLDIPGARRRRSHPPRHRLAGQRRFRPRPPRSASA
jgi:formate dehydrogenase beta subunit